MEESEAAVLTAEVVAIQAVLISVFRRLASDSPELAASFIKAFDEAETILSGVAVKMGVAAPLETTVGALKVLDELRSAVIRNETSRRERDGTTEKKARKSAST